MLNRCNACLLLVGGFLLPSIGPALAQEVAGTNSISG